MIAQDWILTAAHCFQSLGGGNVNNFNKTFLFELDLFVLVFKTYTNHTNFYHQSILYDKSFGHPWLQGQLSENDIDLKFEDDDNELLYVHKKTPTDKNKYQNLWTKPLLPPTEKSLGSYWWFKLVWRK